MIVTRADSDFAATPLSPAERERLAGIARERRKRDWLLGRNAVKQVLAALSREDDTAIISFPDARISLTHGGGVAFAAGTSATTSGIGIDYEPVRDVNPAIARWFLNDAEVEWLDETAERERTATLLRLWTIKEAAFKSYPENSAVTLKELVIVDADAPAVEVATPCDGARIRVSCCAYEAGYLSIAAFC